MQRIAEQRGDKYLSDVYVVFLIKILWQYAEGHAWEATVDYVEDERYWCGVCNRENRRMV